MIIGATLAVYAVTELVRGYGFLAVFLAASTIRNQERDHDYRQDSTISPARWRNWPLACSCACC